MKERPVKHEIIRLNEVVVGVNVESLLPKDWIRQVDNVLAIHGEPVILEGGKHDSSLQPNYTTRYRVVHGADVATNLSWLDHLYRNDFREIVSSVRQKEMKPSRQIKMGVNINSISEGGYELHADPPECTTGLLVATTMEEDNGGELVLTLLNGEKVSVTPQQGMLYIFDGHQFPHEVTPQKKVKYPRVTIPMNYFPDGFTEQPDLALEEFLYGK